MALAVFIAVANGNDVAMIIPALWTAKSFWSTLLRHLLPYYTVAARPVG